MWCMQPKLVWIINTIYRYYKCTNFHQNSLSIWHEMAHILVGLTECSIKAFWLQVYVIELSLVFFIASSPCDPREWFSVLHHLHHSSASVVCCYHTGSLNDNSCDFLSCLFVSMFACLSVSAHISVLCLCIIMLCVHVLNLLLVLNLLQ